jgi:hypothetical protein
MDAKLIKYISEVIKPWEKLNNELSHPLALSPEINDFITIANGLAVSIKHFPEIYKGLKSNDLIQKCLPYKIISDLADSTKHGNLEKQSRQSKLSISPLFERNELAKVRFLRNKISIIHSTYGRVDFMECSMESSIFIQKILNLKMSWKPKIINNEGEFSNEIKLHATKNTQVAFTGMMLEFVKLNDKGKYENVDLNGEVIFSLTTDF